ncbi:MAG: MBL fold metallo-hydrolase [Bacillota bacterium]
MIVKCVPVGALDTNCYIVGCEESREALVIDPGAEPDKILAALRASGLVCKLIVNTHGHVDHIMANRAVKEATGAPIAIHGKDARALSDPVANLSVLVPPDASDAPSPPPDRLLDEGDVVAAGCVRLRVVHVPGHTPGSISLVGDGLVFSGDTLFAGGGIGRTDFPGGSYETLLGSIKKLFTLPSQTVVYPGHGPSTTIGEEKWQG